jgi:DNA-directed RNA polymerase specialized sigma54-like protein
MKILHKIINSLNDSGALEKERHFNSVSEHMWKTIRQIVEQVAYHLLTKEPASAGANNLFLPF